MAAETSASLDERDVVARARAAHLLDGGGKFERANHVWVWDDDGSFTEIELMGSGSHVRRARVVGEHVRHVVTASGHGAVSVQLLTWRDGVAVGAREATRWEGGGVDRASVATVERGQLHQVWSGQVDASGGLAEGLRAAAEITPDRLVWDGRVRRPEPWPGAAEARPLVELLAVALDRAVRHAAAASGIEEPFLLEVTPHDGEDARLPPLVRIAGTRWRERMRAAGRHDGAAMQHLRRGVESGQVAEASLAEFLDAEALRTCRIFSTALRVGAPWNVQRTAAALLDVVGDRLAASLAQSPPADAADPFLALVRIGDPDGEDDDGLKRARRAAGSAHFARFLASVSSTVPSGPGRSDDEALQRALIDREALAGLLGCTPLAAHAAQLAHEVAAEALHLDPAALDRRVMPRSRLGGPAALPVGAEWPVSADGGPLTFLAAIDLSELPPSEPATALPAAGWLLFFADMHTETTDGFIDQAVNKPGSPARVLFAEEVVESEPPSDLLAIEGGVLNARAVVARRVLTLPDDYDAANRLGLDVYAAETYQEVLEDLFSAIDPERPVDRGDHWIGGHITGAQGHPLEDDTTVLLHLGWDDELGFQFQDAGTVQFRIPTAALERGAWSRAFAEGDSC